MTKELEQAVQVIKEAVREIRRGNAVTSTSTQDGDHFSFSVSVPPSRESDQKPKARKTT